MSYMKKYIPVSIAFLLAGLLSLALQGCAGMKAPSLLEVANDPATAEQKSLSDKSILQFSGTLVRWWGVRSVNSEVFATTSLIVMDAATTAALATSGVQGVGNGVSRGLIAAVDFIKSAYQRVDPRSRDNAFNSGSTIVLESQGEYLTCITKKRSNVPSDKTVSPCGAKFLAKINSAVSVVGALMVGMLPGKEDLGNVIKPVTAEMD